MVSKPSFCRRKGESAQSVVWRQLFHLMEELAGAVLNVLFAGNIKFVMVSVLVVVRNILDLNESIVWGLLCEIVGVNHILMACNGSMGYCAQFTDKFHESCF